MAFYVGETGPYSVALYSLSCLVAIINLAVYNFIPLVVNKQARRYSRGDMVKMFIWISLLLHGISAIYTTVQMTNLFLPDAKASLLISCFSSMVFNVLTLYLVSLKMSAIAPHEMYLSWLAILGTVGLKVPSFGLLIAVMIKADSPMMKLGRALTMGGNTVFVIYLLYSIVRYAQFLYRKMTKKNAVVKLDSSLKVRFYVGFATVTFFQMVTVGMMFSQGIAFTDQLPASKSKIHHSVVIALASFTTSVLVYFHTWLDDVFLFALGEIKSLANPSIRMRDSQAASKKKQSILSRSKFGSKFGDNGSKAVEASLLTGRPSVLAPVPKSEAEDIAVGMSPSPSHDPKSTDTS